MRQAGVHGERGFGERCSQLSASSMACSGAHAYEHWQRQGEAPRNGGGDRRHFSAARLLKDAKGILNCVGGPDLSLSEASACAPSL